MKEFALSDFSFWFTFYLINCEKEYAGDAGEGATVYNC